MACDCTPCEILDAVTIVSTDNTISVEKKDCGYDLKFLPNNLDQIISIKDSKYIKFTKEFINGVLVLTPEIDLPGLAADVCALCAPPPASVTCSPPIELTVDIL